MLKDMVRQRLLTAADEIFELFERTIASYEEQLCRAREESERQRRLLEDLCNTPNVIRTQEAPQLQEKQEAPEPALLKEEEEATDISEFHLTGDNEDDEAPVWSQFHSHSPGGEPRAGSPPNNHMAPLSDSYEGEELLRTHKRAEGNLDDTDWDLTFETEDDDSASLLDKSASNACNAEHVTNQDFEGSMASCSLGQGKQQRKYTVRQVLEQLEADDSDFGAELDSDIDSDESFQPHESEVVSPPLDKRRRRRQHEWLRSKMKEARNKGKAYVNTRGMPVPEKNLVSLPHHLCRHKCTDRVSEEERRAIFHNFWDLGNFDLQNAFICASVKLVNIQRRRPQRQPQDAGEPKNRTYSRKYRLTTARSGYVEVCKTFFLATLCVSNGRVDRALQKQVEKGHGLPSADGRGKHYNRKRVSDESLRAIKDHIDSLSRYGSDCARQNRTYLSRGLTIAQMHRLYQEQCQKNGREPEKEWVYRRIFLAEFHQSFHLRGNSTPRLCPLNPS
ncbi:uncharacterized protein LOC130913356 isoform X3 [Corythoichthys intestinalis]|uniref:uncharacterized protein LOC130913356 isoform X3 n=1 Tax=Corythoichthys intestinalis TaxID=161448 RepID=UPI0025A4E5CC|nr:uncharacterized protein LOC130913356 isoform X3 [Corythoichthys intestinalis]